jgi:hypothetical protein
VTPAVRALALVACAGVVLAACSDSPSADKAATTTTHSTSSTTSSPSTTSTSSPASSSTSTTAGSSACNHITAAPGQGQGAAGTITGSITVTNTGPTPCTANGYPTVGLFSGSGAPLTVTMVNGLTVTVSPPANAPPALVTIAPSSTAQFTYQFSDVPVGSETSCPASEMARVTMPGGSAQSPSFALAISPCGNGTIKVSPVYAG